MKFTTAFNQFTQNR